MTLEEIRGKTNTKIRAIAIGTVFLFVLESVPLTITSISLLILN